MTSMEITFQTPSGRVVEQGIIDCQRNGSDYTLTDEDGAATTITGFIVGITTEWDNTGYGSPRFKNAAIKLSTDSRLSVPTKPLAEGSSVDDDTWTYRGDFDFRIPEISPSDGVCILRNVDTIVDALAICRNKGDDIFKLNAGDNGIDYDGNTTNPDGGSYQASFSSGWLSVPLVGAVERATSYRESNRTNHLSPTSETRSVVQWAFEGHR